MEVNKEELRRLADKCLENGLEWYDSRGIEQQFPAYRSDENFVSAANPAAILSLLDEHDAREKKARETSLLWLEENAQLRAENERLRKDAERYQWLSQRVGVSHAYGEFMPWMPTGESLLNDQERLETEQSIDAARAKECDANS